ncbi:reverse transcriptase domain-containing protein [Tanacetum coccineum]
MSDLSTTNEIPSNLMCMMTERKDLKRVMIIEAAIEGHFIHRIYVDGGSASEILYEHCFNRLRPEHSTSTWINFMVVRSPSPYNGIIGRPRARKIQAVPSTTHGILKFPVPGGILTLRSSKIVSLECMMVSGLEAQPSSITQAAEERIRVAIHLEYLEQTITIGSNLTEEGRKALCEILRRNLGIFTWKPEDRIDTGIIKEVHYHNWFSNPVIVKKHDDSWRMCVDFKDLNKACPKDGYPLPEIDWKVESLCGYPFKFFIDAYKGYHQIKMAKEDEEKKAFITGQGIFYYSKIPFGMKNAGATYQRLVEKAFQKQIDRNLEVYVDDLVIKSRTKQEMMRDIEETFRTL